MMQIKKMMGRSQILLRNAARLSINRMVFKDIAQSSYFKPVTTVKDFLNEQRIKHEEGPVTYRIRDCVFC